MNATSRPTWLTLLTLLALLLAACSQNAAPTATSSASSAPSAASSAPSAASSAPSAAVPTSASTPLTAAVAPSAAPSSAPSPTAQPRPSAAAPNSAPAAASGSSAPAPASGSALDAIRAAYKASAAAKSYHTESTITSGSATSIVSTFDIMLPNRLHHTTTINGRTSETITIDATTYSRSNGGEWIKSTDSTGTLDILKQIGGDSATMDLLMKSITDSKLVGTDTLDGKPMIVYQSALRYKLNDAGAVSSSVSKMWVGSDGLPYKLESDGSTNITGQTTTSHMVNTYSGYNTDFKIAAPIP